MKILENSQRTSPATTSLPALSSLRSSLFLESVGGSASRWLREARAKNLVEIFPRRFRANRHRLNVNFGQMEPRDPRPASSVPLRRVDNAITISDMEALPTHRHLGARVIDKSQFRFLAGQQHADGLLSGFVVCNEPVIQIQILSGVQLKREMTTQR